MLHHYITHYGQENKDGSIDSIVESWFQVNIFKWCFCFSKKRLNFGAVWHDQDLCSNEGNKIRKKE